MGKFHKVSSHATNILAQQFFKIGFLASTHRWKTIIFTIITVAICCSGFFRFQLEQDPLKLWIPRDSKFLNTTQWLLNNLEMGLRTQHVLITAPNVLDPKVLQNALIIHNEISSFSVKIENESDDKRTLLDWNDVCLKIPYIADINEQNKNRFKRQLFGDDDDDPFSDLFDEAESLTKKPVQYFNPSVDLPVRIYCKMINDLPFGCYEQNLLELWKYNKKIIDKLTIEDVINQLKNDTIVSPITGHQTNYNELLGDIERDNNGNIISAKALLMKWNVKLNFTLVRTQRLGNLAGTEDWITRESSSWEDGFLEKISKLKSELDNENITIFYSAAKSFGDISYKAMFKETDKLAMGIIMMFIYILLVLSRMSWVELRFSLASLGLLSVGLAFLSACGICFYFGIPYGPVHTSLPFLLMGLGVDDMFVMMACWRKVENDHHCTVEERVGKMLKHAGASITVTSLTDVIAFIVGSFTVIPSLHSFCLYAAVGIFMTYFYAITFYVAVFTFDEYRIVAKRNALIPCKVESNTKLWWNYNLMHKSLIIIYKKVLLTKPGKIIILMSVIFLTAISGQNLRNLEQKFDPMWFIPESTYLHKYIQQSRTHYPNAGFSGSIFMGQLNYTQSISQIAKLTTEIEESPMYHNVQAWVKQFSIFVKTYYYIDLNKATLGDYDLRFYLSKFLFSPSGGKFQANFRFNGSLECGQPTPPILASWIDFRFKKFYHRDDYLPAMKSIDKMILKQNFTDSGDGFVEPWSRAYANWITDEIIDREVLRNIILALICVMFCTYLVILNFTVCVLIFLCVLLTLINVGGFMQMWGLTIDLVSCIGLQLAVGLCVDYAAHIGHTFLICNDENRNERVLNTILHIGAAVLYGGGSTLFSLLLLSQSEAYTFQSFFKIFCLVIVFGLFHGVVFLPLVLSLIGPQPYDPSKNLSHDNCINNEELRAINNLPTKMDEHEIDK